MKVAAKYRVSVMASYSAANARKCRLALLILLLGICLGGCANLPEPREENGGVQLRPVNEAFWTALANERRDPWHRLLNSGPEALEWRLRLIRAASRTIDLETFLWKPDDSGLQILGALREAAERGVRVRLLLDDSFTMHEDLALQELDAHPGIEVRIYNPFVRRSDNVLLRQLLNFGEFHRINRRLHNKTLVVDSRIALTGGRNLADEYFGKDASFNFRDLEVLFSGPAVDEAGFHFDRFWSGRWSLGISRVTGNPRKSLEEPAGRLPVPSRSSPEESPALLAAMIAAAREGIPGEARFVADLPPSDDEDPQSSENSTLLGRELLGLIDGARRELLLVSAYLIPTPELELAIGRARSRGVLVRVLTNSLRSNNHLAADAAYRRHVRTLLSLGVEMHEVHTWALDRGVYMEPPVDGKRLGLHAKLLLVDEDLAYIGSCNLDSRSMKLNTETGLIVRSETLNTALRRALAPDFEERNAWKVQLDADGAPRWRGQGETRAAPPADAPMQRIEDWLIGLLPIEEQL